MHIIYKKIQLTSNQFCRSSTCEQYIVQQNCRHNEKLLIIFSFFEIYFVTILWYDLLKLTLLKNDA